MIQRLGKTGQIDTIIPQECFKKRHKSLMLSLGTVADAPSFSLPYIPLW